MDIGEVVRLLKEGKKVKRKEWKDEDFCTLTRYLNGVYVITYKNQSASYMSMDDIMATDWEEVIDTPKHNFYLTFLYSSPFTGKYLQIIATSLDNAWLYGGSYPEKSYLYTQESWEKLKCHPLSCIGIKDLTV